MQESLTQREPEAYRLELERRAPPLLRFTLALGALSFAGMALVDPQIAEGSDLELALLSRLVVCILLIGGFVATYFGDWAARGARPVSIAACLLIGFEVILLAYLTGGGASSYHEALHATMFGCAILPFPWRRWDGAITFISLIVAYNALLILGDRTGSMAELLSKNALLTVSAMVAATFERLLMAGHLRDFLSREALASANERLKSLDAAKNRFFSNISHELRTPLTLIVAPLEALLESSREPLSAGQRERLELAQRNALRLLRLVDDLLSLSKAEAASLKIHVTRLDLAQLVQAFANDVQDLAARKNITLALELPTTPAWAEGDGTLIERILLNVFGNAAKFVRIGGHIRLSVEERDGGVEIAVSDDGIGIASDHLARVFDRFYQADSGSTRATGGTGIGLSLVKEIVELHGGRVRAESVAGQGTTIACWFPRTLPPECEQHAVRSSPAGAEPQGLPEWHEAIRAAKSYRLQGIDDATERRVAPRPRHRGDAPTILVVEDNPDMIRFLVALMAYDYNVLSAQNGKDGLRMALERRPDLVISDVMMPEMDGFEMVRRLREDPSGAKIPLIFLTARGSSEDRIQGHAGGADTYLAKPFRSEELLAAVDSLLSRQARVRESEFSREDEALVFMASGLLEQLSRITGSLRVLQGAFGDEQAAPDRATLGRLGGALRELDEVTTALRELAEAGAHPAHAPVLLDDALRGLAAEMSERLPAGRILHVELHAPVLVQLPESEIRSLVEPLLMRAVAVTPPGRNIYLQTQRRTAAGGDGAGTLGVSVVIRDEGPSLTPGQIERLFFPYGASDGELGLELVLARRIALARGGSISVEPERELGSRITVHLPLSDAQLSGVAA